jgi:predicted small lipoprotein YifL
MKTIALLALLTLAACTTGGRDETPPCVSAPADAAPARTVERITSFDIYDGPYADNAANLVCVGQVLLTQTATGELSGEWWCSNLGVTLGAGAAHGVVSGTTMALDLDLDGARAFAIVAECTAPGLICIGAAAGSEACHRFHAWVGEAFAPPP